MDEIVKLVQEKTGLSEELSRTAVITIAEFLKTKLPPAFAGHVDSYLNSASGAPAAAGEDKGLLGTLSGLTSLFGGAKE